jgi:2-polyprenyl-3-methyl-5-hydroxy-6-metoxy-1,4-benzoquinol methylase
VPKTESKGSRAPSTLPPRVQCPVCGGKGDYKGKPSKDGLCECEGCKLLFVGNPPPRAALAEQREARFKGAWAAEHGREVRKDGETAHAVMCGYFGHAEGIPTARNAFDRNVLDVGCGLGFRLRRFQDYGWAPYGMDPSASAVEFAKACFLEVGRGWFDEAAPAERKYDLVVFQGTLGCLVDPREAVIRAEKALRPRGLVFVSLEREPSAECLFHFSGETLRRLFMENGFSVLEEGEREGGAFAWFGRKGDRHKAKAAMAEAEMTAAAPA